MSKRYIGIGLFACALLVGCGGGGSGSTGSTSGGGGGGSTPPAAADTSTATFKVDVATGKVTIINSAVTTASHASRSVFAGNTIAFSSSQLLADSGTNTGSRTLNVSLTNQFGLPIGADSKGNSLGLQVLFSPISNLANALDPRPLVRVSTLAGQAGVSGNTEGPYGSAAFVQVQGVACDPSGNLYAADEFALNIRKLSNGQVSLLAGGAGSVIDGTGASAGFGGPHGLAYNPVDGALYVADSGANKIRRVTTGGQVSTIAGTGTAAETDGAGGSAAFNKPDGIAIDSAGTIYVSDSTGNKIRKITYSGTNPTLAANYTVATLSGTGTAGATNGPGISATFNKPAGLAIDTSGDLYVADQGNNKIRLVDSSTGSTSTIAGTGAATELDGLGNTATVTSPRGIAFVNGALVVSDYNTGRLRELTIVPGASPSTSTSWQVSTLTSAGAGVVDGDGTQAKFSSPSLLGASSNGAVFIPDLVNHLVRKLVATGGSFPIGAPTGAASTDVVALNNPNGLVPSTGGAGFNPYIQYSSTLASGATSPAQVWSFTVPTSVKAFTFTVTVQADTSVIGPLDGQFGGPPADNYLYTVAGNGSVGGSIDGSATAARLDPVYDLAVDNSGNVYFADYGQNTIRRMDAVTHSISTIAGQRGASGIANGDGYAARFNGPSHVSLAQNGTVLFVTDFNSNYVRRMTLVGGDPTNPGNWQVSTVAGGGSSFTFPSVGTAAKFAQPQGIVADPSGRFLYITEQTGNRIDRLSLRGDDATNPANWYVELLAGDSGGSAGTTDGFGTAARFNAPTGICTDPSGNIYTVDQETDRIRKITPEGTVTTVTGGAGTGYVDGPVASAEFFVPYDIVSDSAGTLYVCDFSNNKIRAITPAGQVMTVCGTTGGLLDGTTDQAQLESPTGLAVAPSGGLYIGSGGSFSIRRLERLYSSASP